jgi:GTP cyclohydrolase I
VDIAAAERSIAAFLRALGYDLDDPELRETPARVAEAYAKDLLIGEGVDLDVLVHEGSAPLARPVGLVVVRGLAVTTVCPHHLLPALGTAAIGYLPGGRLLGLGTFARLLDAASRRLTLQEGIGDRVVAALMGRGGARGAFCQIELLHGCLATRGPRRPEARMVTLARAGALEASDALLSALSADTSEAAPAHTSTEHANPGSAIER